LHLAFYWSAETRPTGSYRATAALVGPNGQLWSPKNALPRRGYSDPPPSPAWGDGHYAVEGMDVKPHPGTPPGRYDLLLTVFDRETLSPLNILNEIGQVSAPNLVVGQIELSRPERASDPADLSVQNRLDAEMGPLTLVGVDLDREEAAPGMPMLITIFWHVDQERATRLPDLTTQLALVDQRGAAVMTWVLPPARTDWPTTRWEPGDLWRAQHALRIPGSLESGQYTWHLQLSDLDRPGVRFPSVPVALGELQIDAPDRRWQAPPLQLGLEAELGDSIILLGANLEPADVPTNDLQPGATLTVTLAWQAQTELETSYHVFLHLLRPDGSLLVQSDGEPARWTRPTSGWAVGEVVLDQRVLEIPADAATGEYLLVTGLYDPTTKTRLTLSDESTAVTLTQLFIRAP
jgi:hypothetical protein